MTISDTFYTPYMILWFGDNNHKCKDNVLALISNHVLAIEVNAL